MTDDVQPMLPGFQDLAEDRRKPASHAQLEIPQILPAYLSGPHQLIDFNEPFLPNSLVPQKS